MNSSLFHHVTMLPWQMVVWDVKPTFKTRFNPKMKRSSSRTPTMTRSSPSTATSQIIDFDDFS